MIERMPTELKACLRTGGQTTLIVWADLDDDMENGDELKAKFWEAAQSQEITEEQFTSVVFVFAKDRLENWIQYLNNGKTDENIEAPRIKHNRTVKDAANTLAERCAEQQSDPPLPPSLEWSCQNWHQLVKRMKG